MKTWVLVVLIGVAVLLLVVPRSLVLRGVSVLLLGEGTQQSEPAADEALLQAYPASLFTDEKRVRAPVLVRTSVPYRGILTVGAGSRQGVTEGAVAVLPDGEPGGSFVGRVISVGSDTSEIETLFEPSWKSAVRVGASSTDALFVGGLTPTLTRLAKGSGLGPEDVVISVDEALPYGLFMGRLDEVRDAPGGVLSEATVSLPYTLSDLQFVELIVR